MRSGIWQVHEVSSISQFLCNTPNLEERKMTDLMKVGWRQWGRDGPVTCLMQCLLERKCHLQLRMSRITLPLLASAVTLTSPCLFLPLPPSSSLSTKLETPGPPDSYLGPGSHTQLSYSPIWVVSPAVMWTNTALPGKEQAGLGA